MSDITTITVTTEELIMALAELDEKQLANEIGIEAGLTKATIRQLMSPKNKRELDPKNILEATTYIKEANKKIHFEKGKDYLNIFSRKGSAPLIQKVQEGVHTFSIEPRVDQNMFLDFYGYGNANEEISKFSIILSDSMYDSLHAMSPDELRTMYEEEEKGQKIFIRDFENNGQKVNYTTMYNRKVNGNGWQQMIVEVFVPAINSVWYVNYDEINESNIKMYRITPQEYFMVQENISTDFFNSMEHDNVDEEMPNVNTKESADDGKAFSFKRGFSFLMKSNLLLLCIFLLFFINKNSWAWEGEGFVYTFFFLSEIMVLLLFIPACLKPRVYE